MKAYFGYGSLVNPDTRKSVPGEMRVTLKGWRREWRMATPTPIGTICALSVGRDPSSEIDGLLVPVDPREEAVIDAREEGYARVSLAVSDFAFLDEAPATVSEIWLYEAAPENRVWATPENRILRSYLDVVLQGYMRTFDIDGMTRFLASTSGLSSDALLEDRGAPIYQRAVRLTEEERALIDAAVERFG